MTGFEPGSSGMNNRYASCATIHSPMFGKHLLSNNEYNIFYNNSTLVKTFLFPKKIIGHGPLSSDVKVVI